MTDVILHNYRTGECIVQCTQADGSRYYIGPHSLAVAKNIAGRDARVDRVPAWSDSWREAMSMLDD